MWIRQSGTLTNLNTFSYIVKGWYYASAYDAKYGYDKNHDKPMIRFLNIEHEECEKLLFDNEKDRDKYFEMICRLLQEPNSVIEYDYQKYNKIEGE